MPILAFLRPNASQCTKRGTRWVHRLPSHISKMVPPTVHLGPPEEARTPREDRCVKDHRDPSHISKMVPPTIHLGPLEKTQTAHTVIR